MFDPDLDRVWAAHVRVAPKSKKKKGKKKKTGKIDRFNLGSVRSGYVVSSLATPLELAADVEGASTTPDSIFVLRTDSDLDQDIVTSLTTASVLAVDCEGLSLSRTGTVTWMVVALPPTSNTSPLVVLLWIEPETADPAVVALAKSLVEGQRDRMLLFWDVRKDADALLHQLGIRVSANQVIDVQLLHTAVARCRPAGSNHPSPRRVGLDVALSSAHNNSMDAAVRASPLVLNLVTLKPDIKAQLGALVAPSPWYTVWGWEDLPDIAIEYAAFDVTAILFLFRVLIGEDCLSNKAWRAVVSKSAKDTNDFRSRPSPCTDPDLNLPSIRKW